jgi:neck protein
MARNVNHYFNTLGSPGEQKMVEDLIVEAIRIDGMKVFYIPRTRNKFDPVFGEDPLSSFEKTIPIEMYFDNPQGFGGERYMISKFGLEMRESANFIVARRRFNEAVLSDGFGSMPYITQGAALTAWNNMHVVQSSSNEVRPMEGDLIYIPLTNDLFEISFSEHESVFYQVGYRYIWRVDVQKFKYSHEKIQTGIDEIDRTQVVFENLDSLTNDPLADNDTLKTRAQTNLNKTEKNIFGDPI